MAADFGNNIIVSSFDKNNVSRQKGNGFIFLPAIFHYICIRKSYPNKQSDADHSKLNGCQPITQKRGYFSNPLNIKQVYFFYNITELFCMADDFCKFFDAMMEKYTLKSGTKRRYHRDSTMSKAEIMLIMILFHDSGYRCLKHFYLEKVCRHLRHLFPKIVSYNRFVELEKEVAVPLALFIKKVLLGKCTGISFVDSTPLRVCRNQRIHIHEVFKGIAQRGKCSMGWFFGFKLHLICNEKGELLNFMITPGDVDDRKPLEYKAFVEFIYGKLVADKGYIGKNLFRRMFVDGIQLITKLKSNMKGALMSVSDKLLLRKRAIIETVNDELKNIAQVEHSRHRSFDNFIVNILGAIAAYCMFPKKPCINVQRTFDTQLALF